MFKKLFFIGLTAQLLIGSGVWAQTASPEPVVQKCNRVMRNIYVDIFKIKSAYEELKGFKEDAYDNSSMSVSSVKTGTAALDTDGIRYNVPGSASGSLGIDIHFSWQSCIQGCAKAPTLEIHSGQFNNYLVVNLEDLSPQLTNEILRIVKKNAVDFK